jgi:hypothetical protein
MTTEEFPAVAITFRGADGRDFNCDAEATWLEAIP